MSDPLAQVVGLLRPSISLSKLVIATESWLIRDAHDGTPFYCAMLKGACRLTITGLAPIVVEAGDFVLVPAASGFCASSVTPPADMAETEQSAAGAGVFRLGPRDGPVHTHMLVGHCDFQSRDAGLLVSLLPRMVHVRAQRRLTTLVELLDEELRGEKPGREVVLARLLEVLLIEALRSTASRDAPPGLLRGLADSRLAAALRCMHNDPARAWSVAMLARAAALSRSTFFERFRREVGVAPVAYLFDWRMALAKDLLGRGGVGVAEVAERVGYGSGSAFSAAFSRHVGQSPNTYARGLAPA